MELNEILDKPGYEEIAALIQEWTRVGQRQKGKDVTVPLPNYYLSAQDGFDFETLFLKLAQFLESNGLMEFDGNRKVYSFYLKYSHPDNPSFDSFRMLYEAVEHELTKFGHPFGGILVIDITEWVMKKATNEAKFLDFLSYMATIDERTLAVFLDRSDSGKESDEAYAKIDLVTRLERLHMSYKDALAGVRQLERELSAYGFTLEKRFRARLRKSIEIVLNTPGSEGEESIHQMAQDMVYAAYKGKKEPTGVLSSSNSKAFLPDGEWIAVFQSKKRHRLGLIGEED